MHEYNINQKLRDQASNKKSRSLYICMNELSLNPAKARYRKLHNVFSETYSFRGLLSSENEEEERCSIPPFRMPTRIIDKRL